MHNSCRISDKAGNMLKKTVGGKTTTFIFDTANQLVSSTADSDTTRTYTYHADGQLASATVARGAPTAPQSETFLWDGLALIQRGDEQFMNEPHVGGGNPVASSKGTSYFNDALGTTDGRKSNGKYSAAALTAFGEGDSSAFFTGKPMVEGLGHAFLMRNYRAGLAKWQTADPMGYPDGWNQLAYCGNGVTSAVDLWGCNEHKIEAKDGVTEIGYTSVHGLGCWYLLDATCSGTYDALNITFTITRKKGSQTAFTDEAQLELPNIGNVYDACARYSGFCDCSNRGLIHSVE